MKSLLKAKELVDQVNDKSLIEKLSEGILVGGLDVNFRFLDEDILELVKKATKSQNVEPYVHMYRSFYNPVQETLYCSGKVVIFKNQSGERQIGAIESCFATYVDKNIVRFVIINLYPFISDNGIIMTDPYSGYKLVKASLKPVVCNLIEIQRPVMLYKIEDEKLVVIDYKRKSLPLKSIQKPFFPVLNDIIIVNLEEGRWYAHIIAVFRKKMEVKIKYLVPTSENKNLLQYITGRKTTDTVEWDAIISSVNGTWNSTGDLFEIK